MITLQKPQIKVITDESDYFSETIKTGNSEQLFEQWDEIIYTYLTFSVKSCRRRVFILWKGDSTDTGRIEYFFKYS